MPWPAPVEAMVDRAQAIDLARVANDGMAELVRRYPDRFPTFAAALPLSDPDASVKEIRRAVDELGARGFQIFSNKVMPGRRLYVEGIAAAHTPMTAGSQPRPGR